MTSPSASSPPTPQLPANDPPARSPWRSQLLVWLDILRPFLALIVIFGFFCLTTSQHRFATTSNILDIAVQTVIVCTAAYGMTFIIISSGIDLSAGSLIALATVVSAVILHESAPAKVGESLARWPWLLEAHRVLWPLFAVVCGLAVGGLCGLLNGTLITWLRVVPFIITLGTMLIFRGLAIGVSGSREVNYKYDSVWVSDILWPVHKPYEWIIFPPGVWVMVFLGIFMMVLLNYTRFGRHVFAIGSNEHTARLCGVPVTRVKIMVYTLGGACAGLAGIMQLSRQHQADPTVAMGMELDVIAAVVIGGGSLAGGRGSILGTIIGAFIMSVIRAGCSQVIVPDFLVPYFHSPYGLPTYVQMIVTGMIIITAVALDNLRYRKTN